MDSKVRWLSYEFTVYSPDTNWYDVGGVYIFCGANQHNKWVPIYIGQTNSFRDRLPCHENWNTAQSLGATRIHAMVEQVEATRLQIERELILAFQPKLNQQLKVVQW